ncbi:MAG: rod shape-determining protein MreC [Gammaproteobacteria bacterium]|nr:rod shape-determining protein MreC [Gammaproteobacteria bacterium]
MFRRGPSVTIRLGLLLVASVALMTLDHRYQRLEATRASLQTLLLPVTYTAELPGRVFNWFGQSLRTNQRLQSENHDLRRENLLLNLQVQQYNALSAENLRLSNLLGSAFRLENAQRVLIARIMGIELDHFSHSIQLNKGSNLGVYPGQPLLNAKGIVGQVVHVSPFASEALLITDPSHAIPVKNNRNGVTALAIGTGQSNQLNLPFLPNTVDLEPGDLLVTSGLGGVFPSGFPVGRVDGVTRNPGHPFARVTAAPTSELERIHEVLLLWPEKAPAEDPPEPPETTGDND